MNRKDLKPDVVDETLFATEDQTVPDAEQLANVDEMIAARDSVLDTPAARESLTGLDGFSDCLELIDRVRRYQPDCLADLQCDPTGNLWMDEGRHPPQIGRFQIRRQLGQGGFGLVFLANDPELDREVALKVPRIEALVTEQTRQRFLREGKAAASLGHVNIAAVYEAGAAGPVCYITSAYCSGGSLAERLADHGPLGFPPNVSAELIRALSEAMQHAHSRGILHRDLKPSNILFAERPEDAGASAGNKSPESPASDLARNARIVDFGLAKTLDADSDQTRTGAILGTPAYMSPEQALAETESVGPESDVYSLGAILYELLTGTPPFVKKSDAETIIAVTRDEPKPPRNSRPDCPRDLEAICLKCLEKSPRQRYRSASELAADLERFLDGVPVDARRITYPQRFVRWSRRNPVWAALLITLVTGISLIAGISSAAYSRVSLARAELQEMNSELVETNSQLVRSREQESRRSQELRAALDAQLSLVLEDLLSRQSELTDEHRAYLEQALESYRQFAAEQGYDRVSREGVADANARVGDIVARLGDRNAAVASYENAIAGYSQLVADFERDPALRFEAVQLQSKLSATLKDLERHGDAAAVAELAIDSAVELVAEYPDEPEYRRSLAELHGGMGNIHRRSGRLEEAEKAISSAIEIQEELVATTDDDKDRHKLAISLGNLAIALVNQRRLAEAEPLIRRAQGLSQQLVDQGADDQSYREILGSHTNGLGVIMTMTGRIEEAATEFQNFVRISESLATEFPGNSAYQAGLVRANANLGTLLLRMKRADEAAHAWRGAERVARRLVETYPEDAEHHASLATMLLHLAQYNLDRDIASAETQMIEGREQLDFALQANDQHPFHRNVLSEYHEVAAQVHAALGRYRDAAQSAEDMLMASHNDRSPFVASGVLAHCVVMASEDESIEDEDRRRLADKYADRAIAALQKAIGKGIASANEIVDHPYLARLRSREEMQEILRKLDASKQTRDAEDAGPRD